MNILRAFNATGEVMEAPTALALSAFLALLCFQAYALWLGQTFSAEAFGIAVGAIFTGGGLHSYGQGYLTRSREASTRPDVPDGGA
jgi:hypothetical protein